MNVLSVWMKNNHKIQRGVAQAIGISTSTLHDILRKNQMPSLRVAYQIELYTNGAITLYDWIDQRQQKKTQESKNKPDPIKIKPAKKVKKIIK